MLKTLKKTAYAGDNKMLDSVGFESLMAAAFKLS